MSLMRRHRPITGHVPEDVETAMTRHDLALHRILLEIQELRNVYLGETDPEKFEAYLAQKRILNDRVEWLLHHSLPDEDVSSHPEIESSKDSQV